MTKTAESFGYKSAFALDLQTYDEDGNFWDFNRIEMQLPKDDHVKYDSRYASPHPS